MNEQKSEHILQEINGAVESLAEKIVARDEEIKSFGETSTKTARAVAELDRRYNQLMSDLGAEVKRAGERASAIEAKFDRPQLHGGIESKSIGAQFIGSDQYSDARSRRKLSTDAFPVKSFFGAGRHGFDLKTLSEASSSMGAAVYTERLGEYVSAPNRSPRLRDLMDVRPCSSDSVSYIEESNFYPLYTTATAIEPIAETEIALAETYGFYPGQTVYIGGQTRTVSSVDDSAGTITISSGLSTATAVGTVVYSNTFDPTAEQGTSPRSNIVTEEKMVTVEAISAWTPATRQLISDIGQLRAQIDSRLLYALMLSEEDQILFGSGTSPQLQGIFSHSKCQQYSWSSGESGDTKIDAIRRAIKLARVAEYPVTAVVLHPDDRCDIELSKGSDGHYIILNVGEGSSPVLFRVPIVETTAMRSGYCGLGAFGMGASLADREEGNIRTSDSHSTYFVENKIAILAEERVANIVWRPEGFVYVTFDSAPA